MLSASLPGASRALSDVDGPGACEGVLPGDPPPEPIVALARTEPDGSFRRCLLAESNQAGWLAVSVDPKSGMLELRERANSELKGEVVLSCNLKTIGTPHSTGVTR